MAGAGGGLLALPKPKDGLLWTIKRDARQWCLHRTDLPAFDFVIGNTGISAATGPLVANVKERVDRSPETANAVREIGRITLDGLDALRRNDLVAAGRLMDRNHTLLNQLGVGHPMLDRLADAARKTSYGAKLTGAGGGGSIVALSDRPAETTEAIRAAGGKAFVVTSDPIGVASLSRDRSRPTRFARPARNERPNPGPSSWSTRRNCCPCEDPRAHADTKRPANSGSWRMGPSTPKASGSSTSARPRKCSVDILVRV